MESADDPAPRVKDAGEQAGVDVESMTARELRQPGSKWSEERVKIRAVEPGTKADMVRYLFIVSRNQPELFSRLARDFSEDKEVQVLLDRRVRERRQRPQADGPERRRAGRRRQPEGWTVPVRQLYGGDRPCLGPLAKDPIRQPAGRREDGSSFFRRSTGESADKLGSGR